MNTMTIKTTGTHCPSCAMLIEMNVSELHGVAEVKASHPDGQATVTYDPEAITAEAIAEEIRKAGYGAEIVA
jgi:copper chaperone CopZ